MKKRTAIAPNVKPRPSWRKRADFWNYNLMADKATVTHACCSPIVWINGFPFRVAQSEDKVYRSLKRG